MPYMHANDRAHSFVFMVDPIKIPFYCTIQVSICGSDTTDLGSKPMDVLGKTKFRACSVVKNAKSQLLC